MNQAISSYFCPTRVVVGTESYRELLGFLAEFNAAKVLVVVDAALLQTEFVGEIVGMLESAGLQHALFSEIEPDPTADSVEKALSIGRNLGCGLVLAIGGGSTIDVAKAMAIVSTNGGGEFTTTRASKNSPLRRCP